MNYVNIEQTSAINFYSTQTQSKVVSSQSTLNNFDTLIGEDFTAFLDDLSSRISTMSYEELKQYQPQIDAHYQSTNLMNETDINVGYSTNPFYPWVGIVGLTNDEEFNKTLFDTVKSKTPTEGALHMDMIIHNMEYTEGRRMFPWPTLYVEEALGNYSPLTKDEMKQLDVQKFLSQMIDDYKQLLLNLPHYYKRDEVEEHLQSFEQLQNSYQSKLDEKNSILAQLLKNNKPNPLTTI